VQSLNEAELTFMNRNHNAIQSKAAIELALNANFKNITLDLIYGSPWKTDEDWKSELTWALNAGITHLSAYALTVEPKTQLANQISKNILPHANRRKNGIAIQCPSRIYFKKRLGCVRN
jgi:oxygen-independent coproporphyrinogen III oxidase